MELKYTITLYLRIIWELFSKKSTVILSFRNSLITISRIDVIFYKWPPFYKWPLIKFYDNTGAKWLATLTLRVFALTELIKEI